MDGMTDDPPFLFWIFKGDLTIVVYAKFYGFLTTGYFEMDFKFQMSLSPCRIPYYAFKGPQSKDV